MKTTWSFQGEGVKSKLCPFEDSLGLIYLWKDRKGREIYDLELESYEQYKNLEKLCSELGLDLKIMINAEWLAYLYSNRTQ